MKPFDQPNIIIVIILVHNSGPGGYHFIYFLFFWKSLLNLLQFCFGFMFGFFGSAACGILTPWAGTEPLHCKVKS